MEKCNLMQLLEDKPQEMQVDAGVGKEVPPSAITTIDHGEMKFDAGAGTDAPPSALENDDHGEMQFDTSARR